MRFHIQNEKSKVLNFLSKFIIDHLTDKKVEFIINGAKHIGTIESVQIQKDEDEFLSVILNGETFVIPLLEETKVFLGREIVSFDSKVHTTVIEFTK